MSEKDLFMIAVHHLLACEGENRTSTVMLKLLSADLSGLSGPLKHESLLDELLFWTLKYEFPQKLVTFLLSILPNQQYTVSGSI